MRISDWSSDVCSSDLLFVKEVAREMTVKAGQKCTAIRRAMAPAEHLDAVQDALSQRLAKVRIGDPRAEGVTMGALASARQLKAVPEQTGKLNKSTEERPVGQE